MALVWPLYSPASHLGSASVALFSTGLSHTCHLAPSVSDLITRSRPCIPRPAVVFPKASILGPLLFIMYATLSVLSSAPFPWTTTFMQTTTTLNRFSHFTRPTSAYCKHNSTEMALLYIHDCLINARGSQKYHVSVFLTSLLHLILLTITSYCLIFLVVSNNWHCPWLV